MAAKTARLSAPPVVERLPLTQARIHLGSIVKRAHLEKACFILEKDGIPVAALMDVDEFEDYLELQDPTVRGAIRKSRQDRERGRTRPLEHVLTALRTKDEPGRRKGRPKRA